MPGDTHETVTITLSDLKALERLAVQEAKLEILVGDFQSHKDFSERQLKDININIGKIYDISRSVPKQVEECRKELEDDINKSYMSKSAGALLEQRLDSNIRSIKLWIVSTVGGCTGTGIFILWAFKLTGFHIDG